MSGGEPGGGDGPSVPAEEVVLSFGGQQPEAAEVGEPPQPEHPHHEPREKWKDKAVDRQAEIADNARKAVLNAVRLESPTADGTRGYIAAVMRLPNVGAVLFPDPKELASIMNALSPGEAGAGPATTGAETPTPAAPQAE